MMSLSEKGKMIRSDPFLSHETQQSEAKNRAAKSENFPPPKKVKGRCPFYRLRFCVASFCAGISDFSLFTFAFSLLITVLILTSCEHSFEPNLENDRYHFSIYGTLDASADTQWIRVMPVRDSLFLAPKPLDATVILEHLSTGNTVRMSDSLFQYSQNAYAWNFWTTEELQHGETYHLTAEDSEGSSSHAVTTLPADFPFPEVRYNCSGPGGNVLRSINILIEHVERLVVLEVRYSYRIAGQETERIHRVFRHLQNKTQLLDGRVQVVIYIQDDLTELAFLMGVSRLNLLVLQAEAFVVSAGPDWPDTEELDSEEVALPDVVSNVENGLGVVAGVVSKSIPLVMTSCAGG